MKKRTLFFLLILVVLNISCSPIEVKINKTPKTFCNPISLNYRFGIYPEGIGVREGADPVIIEFKGAHYLFVSKSGGYWWSEDLTSWTFVAINEDNDVIGIENYAPGLFIHDEYLYYAGSARNTLYRSDDPKKGEWEEVTDAIIDVDPAFFIENDTLYTYYGCSPTNPIYGYASDLKTLTRKDDPIALFNSNRQTYGWERQGEYNELETRPWMEGAWLTKHNDKYYLQYATPGTQWGSYADGVYISDHPLGPFKYMENSPISYKPTGFITGAGHGCMFMAGKQHWRAVTNSISVRYMFERRISMFPAGFDKDGYLYTETYLGDFPIFTPGTTEGAKSPDWNLLSYNKKVKSSSQLKGFSAERASDENARTAWVAQTASDEEWFEMDLGKECSINAIQLNFDEEGSKLKGREAPSYQSYTIEASKNGKKWYVIVDNSNKKTDTPHDYIEFEKAFESRYIRVNNVEFTSAPYFSIRDLRVFGKAEGEVPEIVENVKVVRDAEDRCSARFTWGEMDNAIGYIIRFGIAPDKLHNSFQVMGGDETTYNTMSLNSGTKYYFTVDCFNESGIAKGEEVYSF